MMIINNCLNSPCLCFAMLLHLQAAAVVTQSIRTRPIVKQYPKTFWPPYQAARVGPDELEKPRGFSLRFLKGIIYPKILRIIMFNIIY